MFKQISGDEVGFELGGNRRFQYFRQEGGRLEMGQKLLMVSGSYTGFLKMGLIAASLSVWGTEPEPN